MPRLIVNADDFGLTTGVNQAIVELHRAGALTSATLMATGEGLKDALTRISPQLTGNDTARPRLSVGCHVVLVDGSPLSPADEIPSLLAEQYPAGSVGRSTASTRLRSLTTERTGPNQADPDQIDPDPAGAKAPTLRPSLGHFVADLVRGRIREAELEREAIAQIRALQSRGVNLTHLDTHKHTHIFPRVLRPLLRAAVACGIPAVRNPFEPAWSQAATPNALWLRRRQVSLLARLQPRFLRMVAEAGLRTTAGALGVLATGTLDTTALRQVLLAASRQDDAEDAVWELVCHPGYQDAALARQNTRLVAARETERAALTASSTLLQKFNLTDFSVLIE